MARPCLTKQKTNKQKPKVKPKNLKIRKDFCSLVVSEVFSPCFLGSIALG
jgi:hypothetical protein